VPCSIKLLSIQFDTSFLRSSYEYWNASPVDIPDIWDYDDTLSWEIARILYQECMSESVNGLIYAETALALLAHHTLRMLSPPTRPPQFTARGGLAPAMLRRVCEYMAARLHTEVTLCELSAIASLTPNHFAAAFKRSTGLAPHAWLRRCRIKRAKSLLQDTEFDLGSIALLVGYANQSSFGVAFRRETGLSPARWRRLA